MTDKKVVLRSLYPNYVKRAEEFCRSMDDSYQRGDWTATVSHAVLTVIAIVDAIAVQKLGRKSSSQNHIEAVFLLNEIKTSDENKKSNMKNEIIGLINMKTPSQYSEKLMNKADAERAVNACNKIILFLKAEIEKGKV
ncbi:TPA: HEPN domain-containing protein [Candidatus Woesearchaeota archaeon]|nr:HEPN domain-containing protein [Candidatus Woesearchaeota archaeon]